MAWAANSSPLFDSGTRLPTAPDYYGDAIKSFIDQTKALVKVQDELTEARATLAKVAAIVADPDAALVVDRIRGVLDLREQGTSETEPVSSPDLHPRNSMAVGSESVPNTNDHNDPEFGFDKTAALSEPTTTPMCRVHPEHFMPCSRCLGYGCTACDNAIQAADDRRAL